MIALLSGWGIAAGILSLLLPGLIMLGMNELYLYFVTDKKKKEQDDSK